MGVLDQSIQALKVLSPVLDMVPAIGGNLKGAAELASEICEMVKIIKENRERYEVLGYKVVQLLDAIARELDDSALKRVEEMKQKVKDLIELLEEIHAAVRKRTRSELVPETDSPPPSSACDHISSWICNTAIDVRRLAVDGEDLDNMEAKLQAVIQQFNLTAQIRAEIKLDGLSELAGRILEHTSALKAEIIHINERGKRVDRDADIQLIDSLEPVASAAWDIGEAITCAPATRVLILDEALAWADTSGDSCVFWMNGLAGTGKSTIARTLCRHLEARKRLAANFFVNRQDQARRGEENIVRTIAHQLAFFDHSFGDALCAQLRDLPMSAPRSLSKQITDFIIGPAAALSTSDQSPLVIVIDALDECILDARERPAGDLVLLLVRGLLTLSGRLKLFLTSRAEPAIQQMFDQLSTSRAHTVVKLHELEKSMVQADVTTFLRQSFDQMRVDMPKLDLSHWPSSDDLEELVQLSGVLFVYASTVVRYVGSRRYGPRDRLAQVLGQQRIKPLTAPYKPLDSLYMQVLEEAAGLRTRSHVEPGYEPNEVDVFCQRVKAVLAVIVLARIPLQASAVAALSGVENDDASLTIDHLSALLLVKDGEPVRIFHPSFPDFMLDPLRCYDSRLLLIPSVDHGSLAFQCLRTMNESLRYNVCELSDPDMPNADVVDLGIRLSEHVPDVLQYACCYWMAHVIASGPPSSQVLEELAIFCRKHLFHWLEVLSLLQFWSSIDSDALKVIEWCKKHDLGAQGSRITQLLQDVVETLQLYGFPIRSHALHTYHSAFVTMPSCLLLDTLDQQDVPDSHRLPNLVSSRTGHLGQAARVLMGHSSQVEAVSYSSDGTRIVSGARDKTIRVWSAISFEELGRMEGHRDWVNSVTFSPKGTWIVSGSDDYTVRIWRSVDLEHLATLEGHQGRVSSVAVSPDEKRIISGSHDKTVCVWCTSNFVQLGRLDGYESSIFSVAFSPQGDRIVFSCSKAVRVFDAVSLQCLVELEATIHRTPMTKGLFRPVALSHDGMHIFAGTSTGRVRVWCSVTFQELATFDQEQGSVDWLSISSDGAFVLSGDWVNGRIHVWNAQSFKEITRFHAHRWGVRSVAFSPDSTRFVSGGMDKALRVWVTDMFNYNAVESEAPRRQMRSLAFSADGAHILLRSQEASKQWPFEQDSELGRLSTVRVWNVNNFEELGQIERVSLFAFSPDGTRAVVHENEVSLSVWSLSPFEKMSDFNTPDGRGRIETITYSPEGTRIVCGMTTGSIDFWSAVTFEKLFEFEGHGSSVLDLMFSADGTRLISRSLADGIRVWDAHTLENLGEIHVHEAALMCMAVSPQGTHVMAGLPDKTVRVWSSITSREVLSLPLKDRFYKLNHTAFSPDGKSVLFVQYSCETQTWTRSETDSSVWTEAPLSAVQLPNDGTAGDLGILLSKSGWLSCWIDSQPRLIWLPHDRRGDVFSSSGRRVAVVADTGDPTILHFPTGKR